MSMLPCISQVVAAFMLVACGSAGARVPSTKIAGTVAPSSPAPRETFPPASLTRSQIFRPADSGLNLSFGRFGHPCELEHDATTQVVMLHCGEVDAPTEAGITVNFYLPGIWRSELITADGVAAMIRDNTGPESHVEGAFQTPDSVTKQPIYFLAMSAVYPTIDGGQAYIIKVAALDDAVYSVSYTRMFSGLPDAMPAKIRGWLAANVMTYGRAIGGLTPDSSWVPYLRSKFEGMRPR